MSVEQEIRPGSRVVLHLSLSLLDGTEVVSTFDDEPMEFVMGDGTLVEGLELALYGLREGADQTIQIDGTQAFGERDPETILWLPLTELASQGPIQPGMIIGFATAEGEETAGAILEIDQERVQVDFNHPLAGRKLVFRCVILAVSG